MASTLNDFIYTDGVHDVMAAYVNRLLAATLRSEYSNVETLAGDKELTDGDTPIQRLDGNGSSWDVILPPADAVENHPFVIINGSSGSEVLTVKSNDEATTYKALDAGEMVFVVPDGEGGYLEVGEGVTDHGALSGLADDDHTQYLLATGLRSWDEQGSDPSTPAANKWKLYFKSGGLYLIDDAATVTGPLAAAITNYVSYATGTTTSSATPTPPGAATRTKYTITALAAAAELQAPSGSPVDGNMILLRIKDDGTARALTYNAIYRAMGVALPSTTVLSKTMYLLFVYNSADSKWDLIDVKLEA